MMSPYAINVQDWVKLVLLQLPPQQSVVQSAVVTIIHKAATTTIEDYSSANDGQ